MKIFKEIWDSITGFIYDVLAWFILLLPESPFQKIIKTLTIDSPFENIMNYINYFVPIGEMITFFTTYLACVVIWYIARWALRLVRYIQ